MAKKFFGGIDLQDQSILKFGDLDNSNFVGLQSPDSVGADFNIKLPTAINAVNDVMLADAAGSLNFGKIDNVNVASGAAIVESKLALDFSTASLNTAINGKASLALDNLVSVAINESLISDTDNTDSLGSAAIGWLNGYINNLFLDSNGFTTGIQGNASATESVNYQLPPADGTDGFVLSTNGSGVMSWISNGRSFPDTWVTADTNSKAIVHSLGTTDVIVQIFDVDSGETIEIDVVERTDANTVTVTASSAPPATNWRVLILEV